MNYLVRSKAKQRASDESNCAPYIIDVYGSGNVLKAEIPLLEFSVSMGTLLLYCSPDCDNQVYEAFLSYVSGIKILYEDKVPAFETDIIISSKGPEQSHTPDGNPASLFRVQYKDISVI